MRAVLLLLPTTPDHSETIDGVVHREPIVDADGHIQLDVLASALPSGAAREATLATLSGNVALLLTLLNALETEDADTLLVKVRESALPTFPTGVETGQQTVAAAGTQEQISATVGKAISIKALSTNTDLVYVGDSTVSAADGYELAAGESIDLELEDTSVLYVDAAVSGEGVSYLLTTV